MKYETNEVMMLFLHRCQMFLLVKPKKKKLNKLDVDKKKNLPNIHIIQ